MVSSITHKREKTESFAGSQMEFEFPNTSQSDVRTGGNTFSEVSSTGPSVDDTCKYLTAVSISSSDTLRTSELFQQLEDAGYYGDQKSVYKSQYSDSYFSFKIKDDNLKHSKALSSSKLSICRSPTMKPFNQHISRSPSVRQFKRSASIRRLYPTSTLSNQSSLKRSNAIKHKEGWITRLVKKALKLKNSVARWRMVVRKKVFKRKNNIRGMKISGPIMLSNSIVRTRSMMSTRYNNFDHFQTNLEPISTSGRVNSYLQKEQSLMDLQNLSEEILNEELVKGPPQVNKESQYPSSYPTPNIDTSYYQNEMEPIYKLWSHYLKKSLMSRIQLKIDLREYKDTREINKRESVLESIISDYETEDTEDDDDDMNSDGFESDTNNGHYSSLTSISSYGSESETDLNSIQQSESAFEMHDDNCDVESGYQSSCYPTRNNSMIIDRERSIKRENSFQMRRLLSTNSKQSEVSNLTYIEDLVTIKVKDDSNCMANYYGHFNPYMENRQVNMTRSPSFMIPRRTNTLMTLREE